MSNISVKQSFHRKRFGLFLIILVFTICGCASQKQAAVQAPVFFPPPPNEPRVQYLAAINGAGDIEEKRSSFSLFVTGKEEEDNNAVIAKPYGVTVHKGKIYICDIIQSKIHVVDPANRKFESFKGDKGNGKVKKPINVAFDKEGRMYVADIFRLEVLVYDPEGNFMTSFGKEHKMKPVDVAVDDEFVYVLDLSGNELKIFDKKSLQYLRSIGRTEETQLLSSPTNFTMDTKRAIYATNIIGTNVVKMDLDGHLLKTFGKLGDAFGEFIRPKGIAVDDEGRIYVVDGGLQNVQIFNEEAKLLMFFGSPNPEMPIGQMNLPAGIAVTKESMDYFKKFADPTFEVEYLIFVTNQFGQAKVSVYGLGHKKGAPQSQEVRKQEKKQEGTQLDLKEISTGAAKP